MRKCLGGVLDLGDLQVADIMVHRTKMETINVDDPPAKVLDQVLHSHYTRVPLWKDEPENIVGVLHTKDLLLALSRTDWEPDKLDIMKSASEPWFVPDTTTLKDQLNQFLKKKTQMALVVGRIRRSAGSDHARRHFGRNRRPDNRRARQSGQPTSACSRTARSMSMAPLQFAT